MRIQVVEDAAELARVGADMVSKVVEANPEACVVPATGETPMGLYAQLAARHAAGELETSRMRVVQLDEYLGLERDDRRSLLGWLRRSYLDPLGIPEVNVTALPVTGDLERACGDFDRGLEVGGVDLAILGLGPNGHLGFNEPPSEADAPTRAVTLTPESLRANARYWGEGTEVPTSAVTLGMPHLLSARTIVLVVSGASKRAIARRALTGPIGPEVPASFLQRTDAVVLIDRDAWEEE